MFGWLGSILLAGCSLPQVVRTYRTGRTDDLSWGFLLMLWGGAFCYCLYVLPAVLDTGELIPLLVNYAINVFSMTYLIYVKIFNWRR